MFCHKRKVRKWERAGMRSKNNPPKQNTMRKESRKGRNEGREREEEHEEEEKDTFENFFL